jgi:hypothetical protein
MSRIQEEYPFPHWILYFVLCRWITMQIQRDYGIYSLLVTRDGYCAMFHASVELNKTFLYCNYLQL